MQIVGKLYKKFDAQDISPNFTKREFILLDESNPNYPQYIKFEMYNNLISQIDNIEENSDIIVDFNIRGKEYQKNGVINYFNSLVAYSVKLFFQEDNIPIITEETNANITNNNSNNSNINFTSYSIDEDLPF